MKLDNPLFRTFWCRLVILRWSERLDDDNDDDDNDDDDDDGQRRSRDDRWSRRDEGEKKKKKNGPKNDGHEPRPTLTLESLRTTSGF